MGRKCTLTKDIQDKIVEILEAGNYQKTAYESLGISERTYFNWLKRGEEAQERYDAGDKPNKTQEKFLQFYQSIKKAEQAAIQRNLQIIQDAAKKNWQAAAWYLERKAHEQFGRKDKQEIEVPKVIPIKIVYDD